MNVRTLTLTALVAVLVALALPVLSWQREQARRARCLMNLRAIGTAMHLYANDHSGWLPAISPLVNGSRLEAENGFDHHAAVLLKGNYGLAAAVFRCPSDQEDGDPRRPLSRDGSTGHAVVQTAAGDAPQWYEISYFYVAGFALQDPPGLLLLADEHWGSEGDCPADCRHDLDAFDNHGQFGRNVLFLDGHGEWLAGPRIDTAYEPIRTHGAHTRTRTVD